MDAQSFASRLGNLSRRCNHLLLHCRGASLAWDRGGIIDGGLDVLKEIDGEVKTLLDAAFELDGSVDLLALIDLLQRLRDEIEQSSVWVQSLVVDARRYAADDDSDVDDEIYHRAETLTSLVCRKVLTNPLGNYARRMENQLKTKSVQVDNGAVWSKPMPKTRMMSALGIDSPDTFNSYADRIGIKEVTRKSHQIRLDKMNPKDAEKLEKA